MLCTSVNYKLPLYMKNYIWMRTAYELFVDDTSLEVNCLNR